VITAEDRAAFVAANAELEQVEAMRSALLEPTERAFMDATEKLANITERVGEPVCWCESCGEPVFEGETYLGGDTPLCGRNGCAPTFADLLNWNESGFIGPDDEPLTIEQRRAIYDAHIADGGKPEDSMAGA
jgi:hypothetical protein